MNSTYQTSAKPTLIHVIAWMTLASGLVNLVWGLAASGTVLATIIGIVCIPFTILPTVLGVFELIYAAKLLSNPAQPVRPAMLLAVFEIACLLTGNVFALIVGVLALVFYNDEVVRDYFAQLNQLTPAPMLAAPIEPTVPEVTPEPPQDPTEPPSL